MARHAYSIRRLLAIPPMLLGISIVLFLAINLAPGRPETFFIGEHMNVEIAAQMRETLGLTLPLHVRYWKWLSRVAVGDFGYSLSGGGVPVLQLIQERLGATLLLTGVGLTVAIVAAVLHDELPVLWMTWGVDTKVWDRRFKGFVITPDARGVFKHMWFAYFEQ